MKKLPYLLLVISFGLVYPNLSRAQEAQINVIIDSGIILYIYPNTPGPNQAVTASIESSTVDLDASNITWSVDGSVQASGKGLKNISFTTGGIGSQTTLVAKIVSSQGTFVKPLIIEVGSVDLLWQGDGYVPPFYKGRTLWGKQSNITFLAIPQVSGSDVVYRWSLDGSIQGNNSGVGKNSFSFNDSVLGTQKTVTVEALRDSNTVLAKKTMSFNSISPSILVYENNPLYGIRFDQEVGVSFKMKEQEVSFSAFPLFFWVNSKDADQLGYQWATNGGDINNTGSVTYRIPEESSGTSNVTIHTYNRNKILEDVKKNFEIIFGKN